MKTNTQQTELGWKPIEDAPRDGNVVLLRRHNGLCYDPPVSCFWDDECTDGYPWRVYGGDNAYPEGRMHDFLIIDGIDKMTQALLDMEGAVIEMETALEAIESREPYIAKFHLNKALTAINSALEKE